MNYRSIASMIDHAVLKPAATHQDVSDGAEIAVRYQVASLCVRPTDVALAGLLLRDSGVRLSTVVGFPHGAELMEVKMEAARRALDSGVEELDVVLNIGQLLSGKLEEIAAEITALTKMIHGAGQKIKVIFENCYLQAEHIRAACAICNTAGVDWVKTSTGFGPGGATPEDVALMRKHSNKTIQIKASGGIKTLDELFEFRALGCSRIGTSATATILDDLRARIG